MIDQKVGLPRILFYLNHPSAGPEYVLVADALTGQAEVRILCASLPSARGVPPDSREQHVFIDWKGQPIDWIRADSALAVAYGEEQHPAWRRRLAGLAELPGVGFALQASVATLRLRRARRAAGLLLDRERPDALVVVGDRRLFTDTPILVEARARGIESVMVPFADGSPHTLVDYRRGMEELVLGRGPHPLGKALAAWLSPAHVHDSSSGRLLFYSAADTVGLWAAGCSPRMPWVLGAGGWIGTVGVLGPLDTTYFKDYGVDHAGVNVVGQPSLDRLYEARTARAELRRSLDEEFDLDPSRPLVICGLPQSWTEVEGWSEADYCALHAALAGSGANILYSLHPKMKRDDYGFLDEMPHVRFSAHRLAHDLPAADVYVASYSSTMRWSLLLRIPSLLVDFPVYRHGRPPNPYPYLPVATSSQEVTDWLTPVVADPDFRDKAVRAIESVAAATAPFDGRSARRLADLILQAATRRGSVTSIQGG